MHRRTYVRAIAAVTGFGSLAGCAGGDDATPTPTPEPTPTPTPEGVARAEAEAHYDDAIDYLLDNAATLDEWASGEGDRSQRAIDDLRDDVDRARESLDDAEAVAPEDLVARIENAQAIAGFQDALLDFSALGVEFEAALVDAQAYGDAEQHERAVESYGTAIDRLDETRDHLDDLEAAHAAIDQGLVDEEALEYRGEYTRHVELDGPGTIDALEHSVVGKQQFHQLLVEFEAGFEAWEAEAFATAREHFEAAEAARGRSEEAFLAAQDHEAAWPDLRQESILFHGMVSDLEPAFDRFIAATHEAEAGNGEEADALVQEGFGIFEEAFS